MNSNKSTEEYFKTLPEERKNAMEGLRRTILKNLPKGFQETMNYGMPGYVVPHSIYPGGYHCDPKEPLPFISIASQKNFVALYHMGLYAREDLLKWFKDEYGKRVSSKLDMGKSCIRFKNIDKIPFDLIGELAGKITPQEWIQIYENTMKR